MCLTFIHTRRSFNRWRTGLLNMLRIINKYMMVFKMLPCIHFSAPLRALFVCSYERFHQAQPYFYDFWPLLQFKGKWYKLCKLYSLPPSNKSDRSNWACVHTFLVCFVNVLLSFVSQQRIRFSSCVFNCSTASLCKSMAVNLSIYLDGFSLSFASICLVMTENRAHAAQQWVL